MTKYITNKNIFQLKQKTFSLIYFSHAIYLINDQVVYCDYGSTQFYTIVIFSTYIHT